MFRLTYLIMLTFISTTIMSQQQKKLPNSKVDYDSFIEISTKVKEHRKDKLIALDTFLEYANSENTILLDTRSKAAFTRKHLKGAVHINFSEFTKEKLAKLIPSKKTRILIYCNNNIDGDTLNFATKSTPLALNIPTFINLYGYGYKNVYELSSLVSINDQRLQFEGTEINYK